MVSVMNSYLLPFQAKTTGQELPRRSSSLTFGDAFGGDVEFVLGNSGRPEQADDDGVAPVAESDENVAWPLAEIAARAGDFPLLPEAAGEDLDLGADGGLVVGVALQRDEEGVVLVASVVAEEDGRAVESGDEQVGVAIAVSVEGDDGARSRRQGFGEGEFFAHVFEGAVAFVSEDAQFDAFGGFDDGGEIDPAVVVNVDGRDAPGSGCVGEGQGDAFEALAVDVPPQRDAGRSGVGDSDVHPAIFVEVEDGEAYGWR